MTNWNPTIAPLDDAAEDVESQIARYEAMSDAEVDQELERYDIKSGPTVSKVKSLIEAKLAELKRRRAGRTPTRS